MRRMNRKVLAAIAAVALLAGGFFLARSLGLIGSDPAEVDLSNTNPDATGGDVAFTGRWTVDTESGSLDEEPPTSTFAGYRIEEEFAGIGANTAVGRTGDVTGTMVIEDDTITAVDITVDVTGLESDQDRRDEALKDRGLETDEHPQARFVLVDPIRIDERPEEGEEIEVEATGDLTLHGVTERVTIPIEARWSGDTITVVSSFEVDLDDYDIERPTTARVVSIADTGTVELQLLFKKATPVEDEED